jgi:hypothetical protein
LEAFDSDEDVVFPFPETVSSESSINVAPRSLLIAFVDSQIQLRRMWCQQGEIYSFSPLPSQLKYFFSFLIF